MRNWHSLYEILKYPIELLFVGFILVGIGNTITSPALGISNSINNPVLLNLAEILLRAGQFLLVNYPIIIMARIAARKGGSVTTITSALVGYIIFLIATMFFADQSLPTTAYSSILGINSTRSSVSALTNSTRYPLQTGIIGAIAVSFITLSAYKRTKNRNEHGIFSFVSRQTACTISTAIGSLIMGILIAFVWKYVINSANHLIDFVAVDTSNPVNLALYGILDRVLSIFNLNAWIRQPFWYGVNGGSWVNIAGANIVGDVNIWSQQLSASALTGTAGKFITPFYILNIFAIPGMIWSMFFLTSESIERRRKLFLVIVVTIASMMFGTLLPVELLMLFLCPLLLVFHLGYTGVLYAVLYSMRTYLGYYYNDSSVITAMPGTLPEFLSYLNQPSLHRTMIVIVVVGVISMIIYFLMTQLYFRFMAVDLFGTGGKQRLVDGTLKAVGGAENIKMIQSSISELTINVYDPTKINVEKLKRLGSFKVYETRAGYSICYGASSTIVRRGISEAMREAIRM